MHLHIKNMVCDRCVLVVEQELKKMDLDHCLVSMGEVETTEELTEKQIGELAGKLHSLGFELLDNNKQQLVEKMKNIIINHIHHSNDERHHNFSEMLSGSLHKDYSYLSKLFSEVEGITIEKFIINHKIEKIKELLSYDDQSLGEIAFQLNYSSAAHLSNQFKKITGLTPSRFKQLGEKRKPLDKI